MLELDSWESKERNTLLSPLHFYGDRFVLDISSGKFYRISSSASLVLHALQDHGDVDQATKFLCSNYGLTHSVARRDMENFISELSSLGLIKHKG